MTARHRVLVLGAGGQLGQSLVGVLGRDYDVTGLKSKELDICDSAKVQETMERLKPWAVINAAAWTDVDGCEKNVEKSYTVNAIAAGEVASLATQCGARMVQVSTDYIFDGFKEAPYVEDDEPDPLSIYGKSKLEGEKLVRQAAADALIVRSSWLFGMGRANFVMRIFESVMVKTEIPVVNDHKGSPTYTEDLARAIAHLLGRDAQGMFHVSNAGECSWFEYAQEIIRVLKITSCTIVPVSAEHFKRPAPRPAYSVLDNSKYNAFAGASLRPWQDALEQFLGSLTTA